MSPYLRVPPAASPRPARPDPALLDLAAAVREAEPHDHYDGLNECPTCDEPLLVAAARIIRKLAKEPR